MFLLLPTPPQHAFIVLNLPKSYKYNIMNVCLSFTCVRQWLAFCHICSTCLPMYLYIDRGKEKSFSEAFENRHHDILPAPPPLQIPMNKVAYE